MLDRGFFMKWRLGRVVVLLLAAWCGPSPAGEPAKPDVKPAVGPAGPLLAGAAKVDITRDPTLPLSDHMYARALVLRQGDTTVALVGLDVVAVGGIGPIDDGYLGRVREQVRDRLGILPENVVVNASHCHGIVAANVDERTVRAIAEAKANLVPVKAGCGVGREDRIMQNRRLTLTDDRQTDERHAYSLPADADVAA